MYFTPEPVLNSTISNKAVDKLDVGAQAKLKTVTVYRLNYLMTRFVPAVEPMH
jgi:hypothetical protein